MGEKPESFVGRRLLKSERLNLQRRHAGRGRARPVRKARAGLIHFGVPYSIALVSLDLSALLRFARRWPELEELAADTYRRFRDLDEDEEALAALKLWLEAAQARTLSEELIAEVKETVERRMTGPAAAVGRR